MDLKGLVYGRLWARTGEGRRLRQAAGLTLSELAAYVGVNPATLCRWEHGEMRPPGLAALRYGQALDAIAHQLEEIAAATQGRTQERAP